MQDFRCHHLYHFLPQGHSWPAPLVGAGTGHEGVGRGESSRSGWCSLRIAPCNSVLFVPSGGRGSRVACGQRPGTRRDLLAYSFIILPPFFPLSPLPNPVVFPVDVFAPLHSCRSLSSPLASASGQSSPPRPPLPPPMQTLPLGRTHASLLLSSKSVHARASVTTQTFHRGRSGGLHPVPCLSSLPHLSPNV